MQIRTHVGASIDGFVATPDGHPALLSMPDFVPGESHGHPEFIESCDAVLMGRTTFEPALGAPSWPWPDKRVYVLTSRPLPAETPAEGIVASADPAELLEQMRAADFDGDVHLVGGPHDPCLSGAWRPRAPGGRRPADPAGRRGPPLSTGQHAATARA
jgi:hypothetical protein